jgi:formate dehydrogenase iron-sulfur subunit
MGKAVLFDAEICIGCRACELACKEKHGLPMFDLTKQLDALPAETTTNAGTYTKPPELSAYTFLKVGFHEGRDAIGPLTVYSMRKCMHCEHPGCAAACPVGALQKTSEGPVVYDDNKCIGCRYCMIGCPFGIPTYQWDKPVPFIRKCTFCSDWLSEGKEPACVQACAKRTGSLTLGEREEQLAKARKIIADSPDKYVNHIYGEKEAGGTSWLFISSFSLPFEKWGLPTFGSTDPVAVNVDRAMVAIPPVLIGVAAVMAGVYWVIQRREKIRQENTAKKEVTK